MDLRQTNFENVSKINHRLSIQHVLKQITVNEKFSLIVAKLHRNYMSELRSYCTVWRNKSKKIKVDLGTIWVVHSIERYQLCINIVFSQLSIFPFRKKSSFIILCMFFVIFWHDKMDAFFQFLHENFFKWVFIYWHYTSIESSWKGESNEYV